MKPGELAGRHLEAAQMALDGMTTGQIAGNLGLSAAAADRLLDEVYAKVGVHNRTELREQWIPDGWKAALARIRRFVEDHGHSRAGGYRLPVSRIPLSCRRERQRPSAAVDNHSFICSVPNKGGPRCIPGGRE